MKIYGERIAGIGPGYANGFGMLQYHPAESRFFELYERQVTIFKSTSLKRAVYKNAFFQTAFIKLTLIKLPAGDSFAFPDNVFEFPVFIGNFLIFVCHGIKFMG